MAVRRIWCQYGAAAISPHVRAVPRRHAGSKSDPLDLDEEEVEATETPPQAEAAKQPEAEAEAAAQPEGEKAPRKRKVYTFGSRLNGRSGTNVGTMELLTQPLKAQLPTHLDFFDSFEVKKIVGYYKHYLVLLEDGRIFAWGSNAYGQLGCGGDSRLPNDKHAPVLVRTEDGEPLKNIVDVSVGKYHSAAVDSEGRVFTWGYGGRKVRMVRPGHLLGRAPTHGMIHQFSPHAKALDQFGPENGMEVESEDNPFTAGKSMNPKAVSVSCGAVHTVVLDSAGRAWTWGYGEWGRLAQDDNENRTVPTPVAFFLDLESGLPRVPISAIKACESVTAFATPEGSTYICGRDWTRQLGYGMDEQGLRTARFEATNVPHQVSQLSGVKAFSFGSHSALALTKAGVPYYWGGKETKGPQAYSGFGQRSKQKIIKISCGTGPMADHRAFVTAAGLLYLNGANAFGQALAMTAPAEEDAGAFAKFRRYLSSWRPTRLNSIMPDTQTPAFFQDKFVVDVTCGNTSTIVVAEDMTEEEIEKRAETLDEIVKEFHEAESKKTRKGGKARTKFSSA